MLENLAFQLADRVNAQLYIKLTTSFSLGEEHSRSCSLLWLSISVDKVALSQNRTIRIKYSQITRNDSTFRILLGKLLKLCILACIVYANMTIQNENISLFLNLTIYYQFI